MHARANGIFIHYRIDGAEGAPWLVFGNPLATDLSLWDRQVADLAQRFRILRYDQRGHGKTDAPAGHYTFEVLANDALSLLDTIGIHQAHFIGLSMGAATALAIVQRHPERLAQIALCDCSAASNPASQRQWEERIGLVSRHGMAAVADSLTQRWLSPSAVRSASPHVQAVRQMIAATPVNGFIGCAAAIGDHDLRSGIAMIPNRTLFLVGEDDVTAAGVMRTMHESLPGSSYVALRGAGHLSNIDQPAAFSRAIGDFFTAP